MSDIWATILDWTVYVSDVVKKLLSDPIPLKTLRSAIGGRFESFELYMFEELQVFV